MIFWEEWCWSVKKTNKWFELIIPSNSNIFFIPKAKSTFSYISETNINISNLWQCVSMITGIINDVHFLPEFSELWMQILVNKVMTYISNNVFWTWMIYLLLYLRVFDILYHLTISYCIPFSDIGNLSSTFILSDLVMSILPKYFMLKSEFSLIFVGHNNSDVMSSYL